MAMQRPDHLPDFRQPPLNEVVLGVQFAPAKGYHQIRAGEVWGLFRTDFPVVEEHPPIPPAFETFGLPSGAQINLGFITGAQHDRFWFLSDSRADLIQFQQDRLLHNWRKVGEQTAYPRFEAMIVRFQREMTALEGYFSSLSPQSLICNQAEISYINHIVATSGGALDWLRVLDMGGETLEDVSAVFRRVVHDKSGKAAGRLICELQTAVGGKGERMFVLTLTVRGGPGGNKIADVIDFLTAGREIVVNEFARITSDSAHSLWGRVR